MQNYRFDVVWLVRNDDKVPHPKTGLGAMVGKYGEEELYDQFGFKTVEKSSATEDL